MDVVRILCIRNRRLWVLEVVNLDQRLEVDNDSQARPVQPIEDELIWELEIRNKHQYDISSCKHYITLYIISSSNIMTLWNERYTWYVVMSTSDDWFQIITPTNSIHTWSIADKRVNQKHMMRYDNPLPNKFAASFTLVIQILRMTKTSICNLRSRLRSNLMSSAPYDLAFVTWKIMRSITWITLDINP